jgi:putative endonuclease
MSSYVYLMRSETSGRYYLGWTTNVGRRLEAHRRGAVPSTRGRGPWQLVGTEEHPTQAAARTRERTLKHNPRMRQLFQKRLMSPMGRTADRLRRVPVGGPSQVVG